MSRPTETAESYFSMAQTRFKTVVSKAAGRGDSEYDLAMGYLDMCTGLVHLNTGLRATYVLLEDVKMMLQRSNLPR